MGEEVVEDVLNLTLGTGDEKRTLDNYINAIFKSPDEWAVIAGAVALQGMSLSAASHLIGSHMANNGATADEIKEVMENTSESDKKEIVENILQSGTVDLSNFYPEDKQRAEEIKDDIYNKLVNANVNTQEANDAAIMVSSFFERYGTKNEESREKFNEFINNLAIKYNIPVEERNSLVYNQPAENKFEPKFQNTKLATLKSKAKELGIYKTHSSLFKQMNQYSQQVKKDLLDKKEIELEEQGLSNEDIRFELEDYENSYEFKKSVENKQFEWYAEAEKYVSMYADVISDICRDKGYIVDINKSKSAMSPSTYIKLYETKQQQVDYEPVKEIRISDHKNGYGDKDIMISLDDDIDSVLDNVRKNIDSIISEEFKNNFDGVIFDKNKIHKELNFDNLTIPQIQKKIKNFYKKYLQTASENKDTIHLYKENIGELHFSKKLKNILTTKKDFELAQFLLSNIKEIVDKGNLENISDTSKAINTNAIINNSIFKIVLPIEIDNRGNWVVNVEKINISQGTKVNTTQSLTDNNSITDNADNFNPDVNNHEDNVLFQKNVKPAYEYDYIYSQYKGVPDNQQVKINLEMNSALNSRGNEIVKPIKIEKVNLKFKSGKKNDVANTIKKTLFTYKSKRDVIPIKATNKNTKVTVNINATTINESTKELISKVDKDFVASLLLNSKDIFENSEYILSYNEAKKESLKDKQKIYRYANLINYENENYIVISTLQENKKEQSIKIYHITGYKNSATGNGESKTDLNGNTNISINDLARFVKSKVVESYNKDYKNSQSQSNVYFQENLYRVE